MKTNLLLLFGFSSSTTCCFAAPPSTGVGAECNKVDTVAVCGELACLPARTGNGTRACGVCADDSDCRFGADDPLYTHCAAVSSTTSNGHSCRTKGVFDPFTWRDGLTSVLIFAAGLIASGAGIGGGGLYVPMFVIFAWGKKAIPRSLAATTGLSIAMVCIVARERNRAARPYGRPLVDYRAMLVFEPIVLLGTVFGKFLYTTLPTVVVYVLLLVLLGVVAVRTWMKAHAGCKKDCAARRAQQSGAANPAEALLRELVGGGGGSGARAADASPRDVRGTSDFDASCAVLDLRAALNRVSTDTEPAGGAAGPSDGAALSRSPEGGDERERQRRSDMLSAVREDFERRAADVAVLRAQLSAFRAQITADPHVEAGAASAATEAPAPAPASADLHPALSIAPPALLHTDEERTAYYSRVRRFLDTAVGDGVAGIRIEDLIEVLRPVWICSARSLDPELDRRHARATSERRSLTQCCTRMRREVGKQAHQSRRRSMIARAQSRSNGVGMSGLESPSRNRLTDPLSPNSSSSSGGGGGMGESLNPSDGSEKRRGSLVGAALGALSAAATSTTDALPVQLRWLGLGRGGRGAGEGDAGDSELAPNERHYRAAVVRITRAALAKRAKASGDDDRSHGSTQRLRGKAVPAEDAALAIDRSLFETILTTILDSEEALNAQLYRESKLPCCTIAITVACWLVVLSIALAAKLWTQPCSWNNVLLHVLLAPLLYVFSATGGVLQFTRHRAKVATFFQPLEGDITWNLRTTVLLPLPFLLAGLLASLLGIGGGMVISPLLLEIGMDPLVSSATTAVMTLFTASSASIQYLVADTSEWQYFVWYASIAFVAGLIGRTGVGYLLEKTGLKVRRGCFSLPLSFPLSCVAYPLPPTPSLSLLLRYVRTQSMVVVILGALITAAFAMTIYVASAQITLQIAEGVPLAFLPICR